LFIYIDIYYCRKR